MPKKPMASEEFVHEAEGRLNAELARVSQQTADTLAATERKLTQQLQQVVTSVGTNSAKIDEAARACRQDARGYTDECLKNLVNMEKRFPQLESDYQQTKANLTTGLQKTDAGLQRVVTEELGGLRTQLANQLEAMRQELTANQEQWAKEAAEALVDQRRHFDQALDEVRSNVAANRTTLDQLTAAFTQHKEAQAKVDEQQDERAQRSESELYLVLERVETQIAENKEFIEETSRQASENANAIVNTHLSASAHRMVNLEDEAKRFRDAVSEVESYSTRRVEWTIQKVSKKLRPTSASRAMLHRSFFSPKFDAGGAHGLQLELQIFRPSDPPVEGEEAGDCAVYLWACKGLGLAFKLFIGNKTVSLEKFFNGRVPFGTKRFCWLKDQVNKADDTLKVGVEILEAVREVEQLIKPSPEPEGVEEELPKGPEEEKMLEGSLYFKRSINNRVYDQVKQEVEVMQSRMTRKVEWRVEHASLLRRCFPQGECICSVAFSAAGINDLQLIFYPSGYTGATEGFCSLYVFGPAGATLRCWLTAGTQRRDASHTFDEPGAFGRTNFCRFESCIDDAEDAVLITLEIEDAQQDVRATVSHPVVAPGDRRNQSVIDGSVPEAVDSVVKLTRQPGKISGGSSNVLEHRKVLPSLWTARHLGPVAEKTAPPSGFQTFEDLRANGRRGASRRLAAATAGPSSFMQGSSSMPTMPSVSPSFLESASTRTALQEDMSAALPALSRSGGGDGDGKSAKKAPRPRRGLQSPSGIGAPLLG